MTLTDAAHVSNNGGPVDTDALSSAATNARWTPLGDVSDSLIRVGPFPLPDAACATKRTGRDADLLTVVGNLLGAQPGESLRMQGRWTSHPQYGRQFEVHNYTTVLPARPLLALPGAVPCARGHVHP